MKERGEKTIIKVRFLGSFQMEIGKVCITEKDWRSRRAWTLLQYLMATRHKTPGRQKMMEVLWPEEASRQPENALKNLVYRVRRYFSKIEMLKDVDIIKNTGEGYALNNELPWQFDFEEFEALTQAAADRYKSRNEKISILQKAAELFTGDFLANHSDEDWVFPFFSRFRIQYSSCVEQLAVLLFEEGRNDGIEKICHEAILLDPFHERAHVMYMKALVSQGKNTMAVLHYEKTSDLFSREIGVKLGREMTELYQQVLRNERSVHPNLDGLQEKWKEEHLETAFLCDIDTFRTVYRLEARTAGRSGRGSFIVSMTLQPDTANLRKEDELKEAMSLLEKELFYGLRRGDVLARGGASQYLMLLATKTETNCHTVVSRVADNFKRNCDFDVTLDVKMEPIEGES